jgi:hypothetical protein
MSMNTDQIEINGHWYIVWLYLKYVCNDRGYEYEVREADTRQLMARGWTMGNTADGYAEAERALRQELARFTTTPTAK